MEVRCATLSRIRDNRGRISISLKNVTGALPLRKASSTAYMTETPNTLINLLIAYGAVQAFFLAFILYRAKAESLFNRLFALLLLVEGFTLFERLLFESGWIESVPHILGIAYPLSFLKPPLLLLMAIAITDRSFRIHRKIYLHFIPFGLMFLMNVPFFFQSGAEKLAQIQAFMEKVPTYDSFEFYFFLSFFVYIGGYIFWSLQQLNRFRQQVINNALVNWYRLILLVYSGFLVLHLLYFLLQPLGQWNFALINQVSMLAMTFIIQAIAFKLIDRSTLLTTKPPDLRDLSQRAEAEKRIIAQFEEDRIHLADDLDLQGFAEKIALPPAQVSQIINQKYNYSFKKLVAKYRVEAAKEIIRNANGSKVKLIDVAFQAGFNNKVSFYRAFKEFEQISPSAYLESVKK